MDLSKSMLKISWRILKTKKKPNRHKLKVSAV